jgi:hypothetical protein
MAQVQILDENNNPVDLATVAAWNGESSMVSPGQYYFQVMEVVQEASSKGNPQLVISLQVIGGVESEAHNGAKMKHWISLTLKAAGRLVNFCNACGVVLGAGGFDDQDLVDKQLMAEVYEDTYTKQTAAGPVEKTSTKIRNEEPIPGAAPAAAPVALSAPTPQPAAVAPPAARQPALPPGPRVAVALPRPGQRIPLPARK